jgi:hypothetical protein
LKSQFIRGVKRKKEKKRKGWRERKKQEPFVVGHSRVMSIINVSELPCHAKVTECLIKFHQIIGVMIFYSI